MSCVSSRTPYSELSMKVSATVVPSELERESQCSCGVEGFRPL